MNYYNEIDPNAAAWLRELINEGLIAPGVVDDRSISDVTPGDLAGFTQHHFFAGIGIWSYALRRAGWSDDRPVWTGSCPCQPFSAAGQGAGFDDERHLWPHWHHLIRVCKPAVVFGEQVSSKDGLNWLDLVSTDLEGLDYAVGAISANAASVGAPHIRQRLYFVADTERTRLEGRHQGALGHEQQAAERGGGAGGLGHPQRISTGRDTGAGAGAQGGPALRAIGDDAGSPGAVGGLADAEGCGLQQGDGPDRQHGARDGSSNNSLLVGPSPLAGHWRDADWLACRDGKWRPVEPGTFPLAHGAPARVGRLRGYGNGLNAAHAQAFIEAYLDARCTL